MSNHKKYWKGIEQLENDPGFVQETENEFSQKLPLVGQEEESEETSRRDFLKLMGFSVAAVSLAACEAPVQKSIPYLNKPEEVTPGVSNWYASSYFDGYDYADVLVKTVEGRPIKVEGNDLSEVTRGAVNARIHASVLSLYDNNRLKSPYIDAKEATWDAADEKIIKALKRAKSGGKIALISATVISPSTTAAIGDFIKKYPTATWVQYDAVSYASIGEAHAAKFGKKVIPSFDFSKANTIVSFDADFLTHWLSPLQSSAQYGERRDPSAEKGMSKHYQFETNMTITGSNADERVPLKPSQVGAAVVSLYNKVAGLAGAKKLAVSNTKYEDVLNSIARELWKNKGKSLVVAGANDLGIQSIVAEINALLKNYGSTIDIDKPNLMKQGDDKAVVKLCEDLNKGDIDVLITYNCNPSYTLPAELNFNKGLSKAALSVAITSNANETSAAVNVVCPEHHYLESWNDAQPVAGHYGISQPTIRNLYDTRQGQESLLKWAGNSTDFLSYMKENWSSTIASDQLVFSDFWNKTVHDGVTKLKAVEATVDTPEVVVDDAPVEETEPAAAPATVDLSAAAKALIDQAASSSGIEIKVYEKAGMGDGAQANNPWLQEMPDPVSKVCWDNYVTMSPKQMKEKFLNTKMGQKQMAGVVTVRINGLDKEVPVLAQPGQAYDTIGLALGYGRANAGKVADAIGANAFLATSVSGGFISYSASGVKLGKTDKEYNLAGAQTHHTMMGRDIVKETTYEEYKKDPASGNEKPRISVQEHGHHKKKDADKLTLWTEYEKSGHFWNLGVDLSKCIGCGSCMVSCQAENNVSVVGKDEVNRAREMHWLRIDRYYSSDEELKPKDKRSYQKMEDPSETPQVVYQPVMCQHCNHAPCETVCPVIATSHSVDGLNQMTYNRCIGTRYCANNCPYKVRRFNWFNYNGNSMFKTVNPAQDDMGRMVLNPDVVVRSRGVMEKCSMCIQRIQEGKLKAKLDGRKLKDGDIQVACSQSCPTKAIVFGDINDKDSKIYKMKEDARKYDLLEEVGVRPNVFYLTKVRNK